MRMCGHDVGTDPEEDDADTAAPELEYLNTVAHNAARAIGVSTRRPPARRQVRADPGWPPIDLT